MAKLQTSVLLKNKKGQSVVEYILLLAVISSIGYSFYNNRAFKDFIKGASVSLPILEKEWSTHTVMEERWMVMSIMHRRWDFSINRISMIPISIQKPEIATFSLG